MLIISPCCSDSVSAGRHVGDHFVVTQCGTVFELGSRKAEPAETPLERMRSSLTTAGPLLAVAGVAAVVGSTLLTHHIQLEVFVV